MTTKRKKQAEAWVVIGPDGGRFDLFRSKREAEDMSRAIDRVVALTEPQPSLLELEREVARLRRALRWYAKFADCTGLAKAALSPVRFVKTKRRAR